MPRQQPIFRSLNRRDLAAVTTIPARGLDYLLRRPGLLELPPGQRQGRHRLFSVDEGTRVLVAAALMAASLPRELACRAALYCERCVVDAGRSSEFHHAAGATWRPRQPGEPLYAKVKRRPWLIEVEGAAFLSLHVPTLRHAPLDWGPLTLPDLRLADSSYMDHEWHVVATIDLTAIEAAVRYHAICSKV